VVEWGGEVNLTGVFWDGPLAGVLLTQNVYMDGSSDYRGGSPPVINYLGQVEGFLMVPAFTDMKVIKKAFKDLE